MNERPSCILVDPQRLDDVVRELMTGLITDGSHHKQFQLHKALILLAGEEWAAHAQSEFGWSKGIAP